MIQHIRLKNFRQHKNSSISLVPGVNTIVGANNSGKSTIPEAIEFALYGSRALRDSAKGYITDGETEGSAVVKLDIGEDIFVVGRNARNAEVRKNGNLDAHYKDNVSTYMAHVTGVNQTGFRLGHYVRQKELAAFSSLRPGKRFETIERMLKINAVDKAINKVKAELSELDTEQKILLAAYQDISKLDEELSDVELALNSSSAKVNNIEEDLKTIQDILAKDRALQKDLLKKPELDRCIIELDKCKLAEENLVEIENKLINLGEVGLEAYTKLKAKVDSITALGYKAKTMQIKLAEITKLESLKPPIKLDKPVSPDNADVISSKIQLANITTAVEEFSLLKVDANCPTCHQRLSEVIYKEVLTDLENKKDKYELTYNTQWEAYEKLLKLYKETELEYTEYVKLQQSYDTSMIRKEQLLEEYVEVNFNEEEKDSLEKELETMQHAREVRIELTTTKAALAAILSEKEGYKEKIDQLAYLNDLEYDEELDNIVEENEKIYNELNEQRNEVSKEISRVEAKQHELITTLNIMKTKRDKINELYNTVANLKQIQDNFVQFKRYLTSKIRPLLQQVAETLFHKTTKNRYASYDLSSDYEITLSTHTGFTRKLSTISGSENDLACLCLRLAIATLRSTKLAGSLGFIILDEISGSFDNERTKQTLEGLLELKDVIPQIINITHKDVEMKYADKLLTVKETNGLAAIS